MELYTSGMERLAEDDYSGAVAEFGRLLETDGTNVKALAARAGAYYKLAEYSKSLDDASRVGAQLSTSE